MQEERKPQFSLSTLLGLAPLVRTKSKSNFGFFAFLSLRVELRRRRRSHFSPERARQNAAFVSSLPPRVPASASPIFSP